MARVIAAIILLLAATVFVRHQYRSVIREVTSASAQKPNPASPAGTRLCLMCNGTGRVKTIGFVNRPPETQRCTSCNGTGSIRDPFAR
jgi:DnaJ-class molecular chaperone